MISSGLFHLKAKKFIQVTFNIHTLSSIEKDLLGLE